MAASRIPKGEDPDFLARAKLPHDPGSFSNLVREAFQIHHECFQDGDIAETLGVSKGRISQILSKPELLKPETIASILEEIPNKEARRRILFAWNRECFGLDLEGKRRGGFTQKKFTAASLKRVDRLIREERLLQAADLIEVGVEVVTDYSTRQVVLDRAFWLNHRLNRPGSALQISGMALLEASGANEPARIIYAELWRLRVLVQLPNVNMQNLQRTFEWLENAFHLTHNGEPKAYGLATSGFLLRALIGAKLTLAERKILSLTSTDLKAFLKEIASEKGSTTRFQTRFSVHLLQARIYLLMGERFTAEELLNKAFRSGDVKNLQGLEQCGLVEARIMVESGNLEKAIRHLGILSKNCFEAEDLYHGWLIETELAMLLTGR